MKYQVGGKIIAVRHGTDNSYEEWFRVIEVRPEKLVLERWSSKEKGFHAEIPQLEAHVDFTYLPPHELPEDLFEL